MANKFCEFWKIYSENPLDVGATEDEYDEKEIIQFTGFSQESLQKLKKEKMCIGDSSLYKLHEEAARTGYSKTGNRIYNGVASYICDSIRDKSIEFYATMLTIDEIIFAGNVPQYLKGIYNEQLYSKNYLNSNANANYGTSNYYATVLYENYRDISNGLIYYSDNGSFLNAQTMFSYVNLRPVITLNKNIIYVDGNGTINNPYIIE